MVGVQTYLESLSVPGFSSENNRVTLYLLFPLALIFLFGVVPILLIFVWTFWSYESGVGFIMSWTVETYVEFFTQGRYNPILYTVRISVILVILTILIAYPIAYGLYRHIPDFYVIPILLLFALPFIVNRVLRTFAVSYMISTQGLINQLLFFAEPLALNHREAAIYMGLLIETIPIGIFPIWLSLISINKDLINASYDLGASSIETFRKVILPLSKTGVFTAAILVFIIGMGSEFVPQLLGGTGATTSGYMISNLFGTLQIPMAGVVSLATVVVIFVIMAIAQRLFNVFSLLEEM